MRKAENKIENETAQETTTDVQEMNLPVNTDDTGEMMFFAGSGKATFSSVNPQTQSEKIAFYNAINSPSAKLADMVNMDIMLKDVYAEECEYVSKETGEVVAGVRIVLIDPDGKSYTTSSVGVFSCLSKIFHIFGHPAIWENPIKTRVKQINKDDTKRVLLLELVQ